MCMCLALKVFVLFEGYDDDDESEGQQGLIQYDERNASLAIKGDVRRVGWTNGKAAWYAIVGKREVDCWRLDK